MVRKIKKTQEDLVIEMLKREGFRELSKNEIRKEPFRTIYKLPECFQENNKPAKHKPNPKI